MNDTKPIHDRAAQADEAQTNAEQAAEQAEAERKAGGEQLQAENTRLKEELRREHEIYLRALEHIDEAPASVSAGLVAIHRRLAGVLEAQGVIPFESVGRPFDPELHEAVGSVESDEQESGAVLDELRRGYRWGEELLRPARVRVAR